VTRGEAHEILGTDDDTSVDAIRRAYLRAVKAHPPERDPDGFQRVREAYELLRAPAAQIPVTDAPRTAFNELLASYWDAVDEGHHHASDEVFERLRAEHGDEDEVRWLEFERASDEERPDIARRHGDPDMLRSAILFDPDAFSDEELLAADNGSLASLLLERGLVDAVVERLRTRESHDVLGLLGALEVMAAGAREAGSALARAWFTRERTLTPRRLENEALVILMAEQLLALPASFPDDAFAALARGVLEREVPTVEALFAHHAGAARRRARRQLRTHAPDLVRRRSAEPAPYQRGSGESKPSGWGTWFWGLFVFAQLVRFVCNHSEPTYRYDPDILRPRPYAPTAAAPVHEAPATRAAADDACARELPACEDYTAAAAALRAGRCTDAALAYQQAALASPEAGQLIERVEAELLSLCPQPDVPEALPTAEPNPAAGPLDPQPGTPEPPDSEAPAAAP